MENDKKMTELINETENLVNTIKTLKGEIESYSVAKNNLIEVKDKLADFNDKSAETTQLIKNYLTELHNLVNSDLVLKVESIIEQNNAEQISTAKTLKIIYILFGASILISIVCMVLLIIK